MFVHASVTQEVYLNVNNEMLEGMAIGIKPIYK